MKHDTITRGDTTFCRLCGKSWDVSDVAPDTCVLAAGRWSSSSGQPQQIPRGINTRLHAFLVGPDWTGVPPCLVYAFDEANAREALSTVTGIHAVELTAVPAPKMDGYCRVRTPCPSFNPADLDRAAHFHREELLAHFGVQSVSSPFKAKPKKSRKA